MVIPPRYCRTAGCSWREASARRCPWAQPNCSIDARASAGGAPHALILDDLRGLRVRSRSNPPADAGRAAFARMGARARAANGARAEVPAADTDRHVRRRFFLGRV